jgi:hypothetical protein
MGEGSTEQFECTGWAEMGPRRERRRAEREREKREEQAKEVGWEWQ